MQAPSPLRAAADAFVEQSGAALERMVIHRNGKEAWFTIKGDAAFYWAVVTILARESNVPDNCTVLPSASRQVPTITPCGRGNPQVSKIV